LLFAPFHFLWRGYSPVRLLEKLPPPEIVISPRTKQFASQNRFDLILFGDSLTDHGRWSELLDCKIANRGIGRETVKSAKLRSDVIPEDAPIFVMLGINDLLQGRDVQEIIKDYDDILVAWHGRKVIVTSVVGRADLEIEKFNDALKTLAQQRGAEFLNLSDVLGYPLEHSYDGIHLTFEGYQLWSSEISAFLTKTTGGTCRTVPSE